MNLHKIETVDDLKGYLSIALQLEHATIPPYLTALYSIKPGTNSEAVHVIRVVVVEEMLHLTLVANMLNAIGGKPDLLADDFIPQYPTRLQDGEDWFEVHLRKFSLEAIHTFLNIEFPSRKHSGKRSAEKVKKSQNEQLGVARLAYKTIGDFYAEILSGFEKLYNEKKMDLFVGDGALQVPGKYFYSGGGKLFPIHGIEDVRKAVNLISEQGEGYDGMIFSEEGELAHYYRFLQFKYGRFFAENDRETKVPSGDVLAIDFDAVLPIKMDAKLSDYPEGSSLHAAAVEFAQGYRGLLAMLNEAFNGKPSILEGAVHSMFAIRSRAIAIMNNPIPGQKGVNAAPIFVVPKSK